MTLSRGLTGSRHGSSGRRTVSKIVVDSWAWVEILTLSDAGASAKLQVEQADEAFTSDVTLAELARKYLGENVDVGTIEAWLQGISEATEIYPIDADLAVRAAQASAELVSKARKDDLDRPGLGDALVLATARAIGAKLLSGDPHFKGIPETIWLGN